MQNYHNAFCSRLEVRSTPWLVLHPSEAWIAAASLVAREGHQQYLSSTKYKDKK